VLTDHDVLENRHVCEQPDVLERSGNAPLRHLVRVKSNQGLAFEDDVTRRRRDHSTDHVEECRLAGTIRADHTDDLTLIDVEVQVFQRVESAKSDAQLLDVENSLAHAGATSEATSSPSSSVSTSPLSQASCRNSS